jgi:hypothetical protein
VNAAKTSKPGSPPKKSLKSGTTPPAAVPRTSPAFERVAVALRRDGGVDPLDSASRGFGSAALKVDGKIFAMPTKGALVVKLPRDRVEALVESGVATHFDPGHGRLMKEWAVVHAPEETWLELARGARKFVTRARRER